MRNHQQYHERKKPVTGTKTHIMASRLVKLAGLQEIMPTESSSDTQQAIVIPFIENSVNSKNNVIATKGATTEMNRHESWRNFIKRLSVVMCSFMPK